MKLWKLIISSGLVIMALEAGADLLATDLAGTGGVAAAGAAAETGAAATVAGGTVAGTTAAGVTIPAGEYEATLEGEDAFQGASMTALAAGGAGGAATVTALNTGGEYTPPANAGDITAPSATQTGVGVNGPQPGEFGPDVDTPGGTGTSGGTSLLDSLKTAATVISPLSSLIAAASGVKAAKSLSNVGPGTSIGGVPAPTVAPPVTMPTLGGADTLSAMQANIQEQLVRRGRAATILTNPSSGGTLGG